MKLDPATPEESEFQRIWTEAEKAESEKLKKMLSKIPKDMRVVVASNSVAGAIAGLLGVGFADASLKHMPVALEHNPRSLMKPRPIGYRLNAVLSHLAAFDVLYRNGHRDNALWQNVIFGLAIEKAALGSPDIGSLIEQALYRRKHPTYR